MFSEKIEYNPGLAEHTFKLYENTMQDMKDHPEVYKRSAQLNCLQTDIAIHDYTIRKRKTGEPLTGKEWDDALQVILSSAAEIALGELSDQELDQMQLGGHSIKAVINDTLCRRKKNLQKDVFNEDKTVEALAEFLKKQSSKSFVWQGDYYVAKAKEIVDFVRIKERETNGKVQA
ncbi:Uncharacterised protein [uncultured archaeon]|nr:Uncharacterised protein [uncultured archaeon]